MAWDKEKIGIGITNIFVINEVVKFLFSLIKLITNITSHRYFYFQRKNMLYQEVANMNTHTTLNDNHRVAITVGLPFDFKFYGHSIKNFTIATGGFLYMSPFLHKFLTATQYIAPLMANFDTRLGNDSKIMYKGLSDRFIVEWKNVFLQDQNHTNPFTFQTILHKNGSIVFAYKDIPLPIKSISTNNHPVKVGLSDAFYVDTKDGSVTRRTIYEYNKIAVDINTIRTCNLAKDCQSCVSLTGQFTCKWCERVQRCSNGFDWYHQEWRNAKCKDLAHNSLQKCDQTTAVPHTSRVVVSTESYKASCAEGKGNFVDRPDGCMNMTTEAPTPLTTNTIATTKQTTVKSVSSKTPSIFKSTTKQASTTQSSFAKTDVLTTSFSTKITTSFKNDTPNINFIIRDNATSPLTTTTTTVPDTSVNSTVLVAKQKCRAFNDKSCPVKSVVPIAGIIVIVVLLLALIGGIGGWHRPSQMKSKLATMKFWKKDTGSGEKYRIETEA
ncbi:hypothetical protein KUTeg_008673 [Tegillarca granosa]|uniref:Uncharacterized protein n=1 Tax=Tegillarca granosa TaxID=220873 RepID=A0ABQ9FE30_TEGGR|nr:hypothetical protein KUTeg_008673 [Tegillarca granosa]